MVDRTASGIRRLNLHWRIVPALKLASSAASLNSHHSRTIAKNLCNVHMCYTPRKCEEMLCQTISLDTNSVFRPKSWQSRSGKPKRTGRGCRQVKSCSKRSTKPSDQTLNAKAGGSKMPLSDKEIEHRVRRRAAVKRIREFIATKSAVNYDQTPYAAPHSRKPANSRLSPCGIGPPKFECRRQNPG